MTMHNFYPKNNAWYRQCDEIQYFNNMMTIMTFKVYRKKSSVCKPFKWYPGNIELYICTYANMHKNNEVAPIIETQMNFRFS